MADEKRIRKGFQSGTLGDTLAEGGTTITFGAAPGFATLAADQHIAIVLDPDSADGAPEIVYVTAYTADATTATIARAQEGTVAREHASGTVWRHGPTVRDQSMGRIAFIRDVAGDISFNSATWANLQTRLDLTIKAQVGDLIEVGISVLLQSQATTILIDAATWDGAALQRWFGSGEPTTSTGDGVGGWIGGASMNAGGAGSAFMVLAAADIVAGAVTVRFRARSSGAKTVSASATHPFVAFLRNHGPQEA